MTDTLRAAAQAVLDRWDSLDWKAAPTADYMNRLRAALAAAPQPAPDREALVEVIESTVRVNRYAAEAIADALLARGLRLPGGDATMGCKHCGQKQRLEYLECTECGKFGDVRVVEGGDDAA